MPKQVKWKFIRWIVGEHPLQSLLFRCDTCHNSQTFWNTTDIDEQGDCKKKRGQDYSYVLGGRLIGAGYEKMKIINGALNIPPPLSSNKYFAIQKELAVMAEKEASASMDKAKRELEEFGTGIDDNTKCVHVIAGYDGTYQSKTSSRYCFASALSTETKKVLAYDVACNSCSRCISYENKKFANSITEKDLADWDIHKKEECGITHPNLPSSHLETALAFNIVDQAHKRGIVFSTMVCDGDNNSVEELNKAEVYKKDYGIDTIIEKMECLTHVTRKLMNDLMKYQGA